MKTYALTPWREDLLAAIDRHQCEDERGQRVPGAYRRWTFSRPPADATAANPYGCADAANLLYTLGALPCRPEARRAHTDALRGFGSRQSGLFEEATHHPLHVSAHCLAALELFDPPPSPPPAVLEQWADPAQVPAFLEQLDWAQSPWNASHQGAGLFVIFALTGRADAEWQGRYFDWLARENCPETGMWRRGLTVPIHHKGWGRTRFPHLAGTFHYLFNHEYARRPLPHPQRLVDTCLAIAQEEPGLHRGVSFAAVDWIYCLNRALRQCGHRFPEARAALDRFADAYLDQLLARDPATDPAMDDLHRLFGAVCAVAELQQALPGKIHSIPPLKLVLDRRPFI